MENNELAARRALQGLDVRIEPRGVAVYADGPFSVKAQAWLEAAGLVHPAPAAGFGEDYGRSMENFSLYFVDTRGTRPTRNLYFAAGTVGDLRWGLSPIGVQYSQHRERQSKG